MKITNGDCLHVVLFGTFLEAKYFLGDYRASFDLIGINANLLAHAPEGIAAFLARLQKKQYFIDPQTYAFQQPLKTIMVKRDGQWVLKKSVEKLSSEYGPFVAERAGKTLIRAGELSDKDLKGMADHVLAFERNRVVDALSNLDVKEFLEFSGQTLNPSFLIAPYFYLEPDNFESELTDNIRFVSASRKVLGAEGEALYAEIVVSKEILADGDKTDDLCKRYSKSAADGFLLWVDDFNETMVSKFALSSYCRLIKVLSATGRPVINIHGSFLSVVAASPAVKWLAGVGHGVEYGESRAVVPVGGGVPLAKFYFPRFHKRVDYSPDAEDVLLEMGWARNSSTYSREVCACEQCAKLTKGDVKGGFSKYGDTKISPKNGKAYPTAEAMDMSRRHYLNAKTAEYEFCRRNSLEAILQILSENVERAANIKSHSFSHLAKWHEVLSVAAKSST